MKSLRVFLLLWIVIATTQSLGQDKLDEDEFRRIAGQLRCPTCTGLSVLESDAPFSLQLQKIVKDKMQDGKSESEIIEYFTARYGDWILREPPKKGINLIAWLLPIALLVFGPLLVWVFVWRKRKPFNTQGIRSLDQLLVQFHEELAQSRSGSKTA